VHAGACKVNDAVVLQNVRLRVGDRLEVTLDAGREGSMTPDAIDLSVLYEDECLLAIDKPAGMLSHPTKHVRRGTVLNAMAARYAEAGLRVGLAHRLDRDTSGVLLLAKETRWLGALMKQFQQQKPEKAYLALVHGRVEGQGRIDAAIDRNEARKPQWTIHVAGRAAVSDYAAIESGERASLLCLWPRTGRTNQLRLHCQHMGHSIVGDTLYGGEEHEQRLYLHARSIRLRHPALHDELFVQAPLPASFMERGRDIGLVMRSADGL
jgi:23S rRNA pseudouridine1911/1915/1917 synthase